MTDWAEFEENVRKLDRDGIAGLMIIVEAFIEGGEASERAHRFTPWLCQRPGQFTHSEVLALTKAAVLGEELPSHLKKYQEEFS